MIDKALDIAINEGIHTVSYFPYSFDLKDNKVIIYNKRWIVPYKEGTLVFFRSKRNGGKLSEAFDVSPVLKNINLLDDSSLKNVLFPIYQPRLKNCPEFPDINFNDYINITRTTIKSIGSITNNFCIKCFVDKISIFFGHYTDDGAGRVLDLHYTDETHFYYCVNFPPMDKYLHDLTWECRNVFPESIIYFSCHKNDIGKYDLNKLKEGAKVASEELLDKVKNTIYAHLIKNYSRKKHLKILLGKEIIKIKNKLRSFKKSKYTMLETPSFARTEVYNRGRTYLFVSCESIDNLSRICDITYSWPDGDYLTDSKSFNFKYFFDSTKLETEFQIESKFIEEVNQKIDIYNSTINDYEEKINLLFNEAINYRQLDRGDWCER